MRTFEHFPSDKQCPICGTNDDKPCALVAIDGTGDGHIAEAEVFHEECLTDEKRMQFSPTVGIVYIRVKGK